MNIIWFHQRACGHAYCLPLELSCEQIAREDFLFARTEVLQGEGMPAQEAAALAAGCLSLTEQLRRWCGRANHLRRLSVMSRMSSAAFCS